MILFAVYILMIPLTSLFVLGIYVSTRHWEEVMPDGTIKLGGYVNKGWSLFWEGVTGYRKIYYKGEQLREKYNELAVSFPEYALALSPTPEGLSLEMDDHLKDWDIQVIGKALQVKTYINAPYLFFYINEPIYRFPQWVRMPMSGCYKCMSSVYGSFVYWIAYTLSGVTMEPFLAKFAFWLFFIVILVPTNIIVYEKIKNDV